MIRRGWWFVVVLLTVSARAARFPEPAVRIGFDDPPKSLALANGLEIASVGNLKALQFKSALQHATLPLVPAIFKDAKAMTVTAWVLPRRTGEQYFVSRGDVTVGPQGERLFPPAKGYVSFLLGTDQHGFFMGTINGNGSMPFPFVTLNEVPIDSWSYLAVTKDAAGHHRFYVNGVLVWTDEASAHAPVARPGMENADERPPLRLHMPMGGSMGEVCLYRSALDAQAIRQSFEAGRAKYHPTLPAAPVAFREITPNPNPHLWNRSSPVQGPPPRLTSESWREHRSRILKDLPKVIGTPPADVADYYRRRDAIRNGDYSSLAADLDGKALSEEDCGTYVRKKVSLRVQSDDRMYAWLLVPRKPLARRAPAVIAIYGTTSGAGKDTTVGLSGPKPGTPPAKNRAFAIDFVEAGFVVLAPDFLRDGERIAAGDRPYDTTRFYKQFPDWSIHAKDSYDASRAVDYLQSLPFVDSAKIAMTGHSYGGHSAIFATALEPRIAAACASGPVSDFLHHGMHWGVPKGGGNSQSMPNLRPYLLDFDQPQDSALSTQDYLQPVPVTFYEFTSLIAPRPLLVFQAVGERRPFEEENASAVRQVYDALGAIENVRYLWHPGDHDYPPAARALAVEWFKRHLTK
jgi:dienelactone hydrolase